MVKIIFGFFCAFVGLDYALYFTHHENYRFNKYCLFESSVRVPMIIRI